MSSPVPAIIEDYLGHPEYFTQLRQNGVKIVLTQGVFDLIHIGHARYCAEASQQGDVLIVGVDSDEKVRKRKGPDRPVVPQAERMEMLTRLKGVDHVVLKPIDRPKWELIKLIKPDVLVATAQTYTDEEIDQLKEFCKEVVVLKPLATTSTSAKIRLLQIGAAKKISESIRQRMIEAVEGVLNELKH
jgi:D-glycero-beta-D-manno-heptose 1-phosphate adenylyltransferase